MELGAILRRVWLFSQLDDAQIEQIKHLCRRRGCAPRETVVAQGDDSGDLFAVVSGRLKVATANGDGGEMVLSILGAGDVFGEVALLDDQPRSASVSALERCDLLVLDRRAFRALLLRMPPLSLALMRVLARRLRDLSDRAQDVSLLDVTGRLARALLALARRFGGPTPAGLAVELKLSQQELGEMVGATREMVNRCLRRWTDAGIIDLTGTRLVIRDAAALEGLA